MQPLQRRLIPLLQNPRKLRRLLPQIQLLGLPDPGHGTPRLALRVPVLDARDVGDARDDQRAFLAVDLARRVAVVDLRVAQMHREGRVREDEAAAAVGARRDLDGPVLRVGGRAEEVDGCRDAVHAQVDERAAAHGQVEDVGRFAREHLLVAAAVLCVGDACAVEGAEGPDGLLEQLEVGLLDVAEGFDEGGAVGGGGLEEVLEFGDGAAAGFFEDDVLLREEHLFGLCVVEDVGAGDVDG